MKKQEVFKLKKYLIYYRYFCKTGFYLLVILLFLAACGQSPQKPAPEQQSAQEGQKEEKVSQKLKDMETKIEEIISALEGPAVGVESKKSNEQTQQQDSQSSGGQSNSQSQGGQQQGQENSQGQNEQQGQQGQTNQKTQQQPEDPWKDISPIMNNLHYQWNDYMPEAVKKGADMKIIDNFSNALINLTNTIITKDKIKTLTAANNLYAHIAELYSLYRTKMSSEIKRMRYYIRNTILDSMTANWPQADKDTESLKTSWSLFKNTLDKEQQKDSGKLDFSIYELEKVVKEKSIPLADIKGRVALSIIGSIEKSFEKESSQ